MVIEINNKKRGVKFGYGAIRRVVQQYGYKKPSDYEKIIKKVDLDNLEDPSFEQLDFLGNLFKAAILNSGGKDDFTADDVIDVITKEPDVLQDLMKLFIDSQVPNDVVDPSHRLGK